MLKIIISPAKKMNLIDEFSFKLTDPVFLEETGYLHTLLKEMALEELQTLWHCSDRLAKQNYERLHSFSPNRASSPALLAYEGIQYQYMAPQVFSDSQWDYVLFARNLRINRCRQRRSTSCFSPSLILFQLKRSSRLRKQPRQNSRSSDWQIPRHGLWTGKNSNCSATSPSSDKIITIIEAVNVQSSNFACTRPTGLLHSNA